MQTKWMDPSVDHRAASPRDFDEKLDILPRRHLTRCHNEIVMLDPAATLNRGDTNVVGRIGKDHGGEFAPHEYFQGLCV